MKTTTADEVMDQSINQSRGAGQLGDDGVTLGVMSRADCVWVGMCRVVWRVLAGAG